MRGARIALAVALIVIAVAAAFEAINLLLGYPQLVTDSVRHWLEAFTIALAGLALSAAWFSWPRGRESSQD